MTLNNVSNDSKLSFEEKLAALRAQVDNRTQQHEAWMQAWQEKQEKTEPSKLARLKRWIGLSIALNSVLVGLFLWSGLLHS